MTSFRSSAGKQKYGTCSQSTMSVGRWIATATTEQTQNMLPGSLETSSTEGSLCFRVVLVPDPLLDCSSLRPPLIPRLPPEIPSHKSILRRELSPRHVHKTRFQPM
jgi:hypothetical protein